MRKINFRAKTINTENIIESMTIKRKKDMFFMEVEPNTFLDVIPETISQYIGINDKNGNEIYENDIVEIIHPCWTNKCEVKFINGCFCFVSLDEVNEGSLINGFSFMKEKWKIEIIGNIHDKPNS